MSAHVFIFTENKGTFVGVHRAVHHVDQVAQVVEKQPKCRTGVLQLPEHGAADDQQIVVQHSRAHDP